jgi:hypothetical protein
MTRRDAANEAGFSLVEAVIAMGILATALLSLAGVFALGLKHLATSSPNLIAREKAREAVESVHTARDTRTLTWADINNVASGGVFLAGAQSMRKSGDDGLVNTADDAAEAIEELVAPGYDGVLGTPDDRKTPLANFTRQIEITNLLDANGQVIPTLRQIRVTVRYRMADDASATTPWRQYVLTTYISSIS